MTCLSQQRNGIMTLHLLQFTLPRDEIKSGDDKPPLFLLPIIRSSFNPISTLFSETEKRIIGSISLTFPSPTYLQKLLENKKLNIISDGSADDTKMSAAWMITI